MTLSAAEILGLGGLRAEILRIPDDGLLVLTLKERLGAQAQELLATHLLRLADAAGIDANRILVLDNGATLEGMSDAQLERAGLRRMW